MNKNDKRNTTGLAIGMCLGVAIGTAIGAMTDNMGLWIPIGISVGMCLGLAFGNGKRRRLLLVERTARHISGAGSFKCYAAPDNVHDIDRGFYVFDRFGIVFSGHGYPPS